MSAEIIKLTASRRTESGKGPSRRLRRDGKSPAIAYGKEIAPLALAVSPKELKTALSGPLGRNTVMELVIDAGAPGKVDPGKVEKMTVLVKQYAHHPVSREIVHADFVQIALDKPVDVQVALRLFGKCKGVVAGGILGQVYRTVPVRCLPQKIPAVLELDVTELGLNESMKVSQLPLPEGVTVTLSPEQTIAVVTAPEKKGEEEAAPGAAAAAAAPAAGAKAAAPAAAAAKAPAKDDKAKAKK
jgi:large subunit ribosomal protein L25